MGGDDLTDSFNIEPVGFEDDHAEYFLDDSEFPASNSITSKHTLRKTDSKKGSQLSSVKKKKKKLKRRRITEDESVMNPSCRGGSSDFLQCYYDFLSRKKYSSLELDEIRLEEKHFCCIPASLDSADIASCLSDVLLWDPANYSKSSKSAQVVVLCSAAMRCVELINVLKNNDKMKPVFISKMFSTHMKVEEQAKILKKETIHLCVGTPVRLSKLLDEGHLEMDKCGYVIIDFNWRNSKYKRIVDIPETISELVTFLVSIYKFIHSHVTKLVIF